MNKSKIPSLITLLVLTLITAVMWVGFSVYRALAIKPSPSVPQEVSEPLTPTLDTASLKKIEARIFLNDSEIPEITLSTTSTPSPTIAPARTASPSAIPSPTPATESGTL